MIASAELKKAEAFSGAIKRNFETNKKLIERFGQMAIPGKGSNAAWSLKDHNPSYKEPTVTAASIGTDMTSQHYDIIIMDDIINRKMASSEDQRQKVIDFYMDCLDLLEPTGKMIIIGTRWHFADIYCKLMEINKKHKVFKFIVDEPMMFHPLFTRRDFQKMLDSSETTFLFPEKFNRKEAQRLYNDKISQPGGVLEYSSQQMNFPVSDANAPFRFEDIKFIPLNEVPLSCVLYQTIDPAGSDTINAKQDDTAIVTTGIDINLDLYNMDCWAEQTTIAGLFMQVFIQANKWPQTRKIGIEKNFNATNALYIKDKFPTLASKLYPYRAPTTTDKASRIMALQPYVANGKFYIVEHPDGTEYQIGERIVRLHPGQYKLLLQLIDFGSTEHDDCADAQAATLEFIKKPKPIRASTMNEYIPQDSITGY